jgi:hypothetical protein
MSPGSLVDVRAQRFLEAGHAELLARLVHGLVGAVGEEHEYIAVDQPHRLRAELLIRQ